MDRKARKRLSKFCSLVLRHRPEAAGLTLDGRGYCPIDRLLEAAANSFSMPVSRADLEDLAGPPRSPGEKTRFEIEGDFIRAGHGHSIDVGGYRPTVPTGPLYHATPAAAVSAIRREGLRSMGRQKVHLSYDRDITVEAARRRSRDTVLVEVDWEKALAAGVGFYESADVRIVLSDDVPPDCLHIARCED